MIRPGAVRALADAYRDHAPWNAFAALDFELEPTDDERAEARRLAWQGRAATGRDPRHGGGDDGR